MTGNANAASAAAEPLTGVVVETVPMTVLKPALKRVSMAADQQPQIVYQQVSFLVSPFFNFLMIHIILYVTIT